MWSVSWKILVLICPLLIPPSIVGWLSVAHDITLQSNLTILTTTTLRTRSNTGRRCISRRWICYLFERPNGWQWMKKAWQKSFPFDSMRPKDKEGRIQIHVDFLRDDLHCEFREKMSQKTGHPGEFHRCSVLESEYRRMPQTSQVEKLGAVAIVQTSIPGGLPIDNIHGSLLGSICLCGFDHQASVCAVQSVCKWRCPVLLLGQDEIVHKQNSMAKRYWSVDEKQKLRKKKEGKGLMMSAFIDSYHGFRFPFLSHLHLFKHFQWSKFRDYSKDGYWTGTDFIDSTHTTIQKMTSIHPNFQIALEADQSSGHLKKEGTHLNVSNMNLEFRREAKSTSRFCLDGDLSRPNFGICHSQKG